MDQIDDDVAVDVNILVSGLEAFYQKVNIYKAILVLDLESDAQVADILSRLTAALFPVGYVTRPADARAFLECCRCRLLVMRPWVYEHMLTSMREWHGVCNFIACACPQGKKLACQTRLASRTMEAWKGTGNADVMSVFTVLLC